MRDIDLVTFSYIFFDFYAKVRGVLSGPVSVPVLPQGFVCYLVVQGYPVDPAELVDALLDLTRRLLIGVSGQISGHEAPELVLEGFRQLLGHSRLPFLVQIVPVDEIADDSLAGCQAEERRAGADGRESDAYLAGLGAHRVRFVVVGDVPEVSFHRHPERAPVIGYDQVRAAGAHDVVAQHRRDADIDEYLICFWFPL